MFSSQWQSLMTSCIHGTHACHNISVLVYGNHQKPCILYFHTLGTIIDILKHICHDFVIACECSTLYRVTSEFVINAILNSLSFCTSRENRAWYLHMSSGIRCSHKYTHTNIYYDCKV